MTKNYARLAVAPQMGQGMMLNIVTQSRGISFLARDVFVRTSHRAIAMMFVCLSGMGMRCDHTVHFIADLSSRFDSPMFGHPDTKACPPTASRLFPVPPRGEVGYGDVQTR